ncbi:hypothetical protein D3C72_1733740 [compost metagenome]
MRGAAGQRAPRRTGRPDHPPRAARCAGPADGRRSGQPGMGRGRTLSPDDPRHALRRPCAWPVRRPGQDAVRGLQRPPGRAWRLPPPRRGEPPSARPARGTPDRHHLRRRHSGNRRLRRAAGAPGHAGGQRARGFRRGKPGRRCVPAGQPVVPHHPCGARAGAGGGRPRAAAEHSLLAGRGAGEE